MIYKGIPEEERIESEFSAFFTLAKIYNENSELRSTLYEYFKNKPEYFGRLESISLAKTGKKGEFKNPEISKKLFGENIVAIEVFPEEKSKIDAQDIYHLWVMPKGFKLPFGIHVKRDKQCEVINRGCPKDITRLVYGSAEIRGIE